MAVRHSGGRLWAAGTVLVAAAIGLAGCNRGSAQDFCALRGDDSMPSTVAELAAVAEAEQLLDDAVAAAPDELDPDTVLLRAAYEQAYDRAAGVGVAELDRYEVRKAIEHIREFEAGNC